MITDQSIKKQILGYYNLEGDEDGAKLGLTKKPNRFRIICAFLFMGWVWNDVNKK